MLLFWAKRTLLLDFKSLIVQKGLCFLILSSLIFSPSLSLSLSLWSTRSRPKVDPKSPSRLLEAKRGSLLGQKRKVGSLLKRFLRVSKETLKRLKKISCLLIYWWYFGIHSLSPVGGRRSAAVSRLLEVNKGPQFGAKAKVGESWVDSLSLSLSKRVLWLRYLKGTP